VVDALQIAAKLTAKSTPHQAAKAAGVSHTLLRQDVLGTESLFEEQRAYAET
jgi:hypothetical protein